MKVLFENFALNSTVTSETFSANYPPSNLTHIFLRKRYQNTTGSDLITFQLDQDRSVNSFYLGFHNADEIALLTEAGENILTEAGESILIASADVTVKLYDYNGTLLYTHTGTLSNQFEAYHFTQVDLVRSVTLELDWLGLGNIGYMGGAGFGMSYAMPDPVANWIDGLSDNSVYNKNLIGQYTQNYVEPQNERTFSFFGVRRETFDEIKALVRSVGIGRPLWVDFFEEAHDIMLPCYCVCGGLDGVSNAKMVYAFQIKFTEAR